KDTAVLHLTITTGTRTDTTVSACTSYTWRGKTYTQSEMYGETTVSGVCKDTAVLHLTITTGTRTDTTVSACTSYTWRGKTYTQSRVDGETTERGVVTQR